MSTQRYAVKVILYAAGVAGRRGRHADRRGARGIRRSCPGARIGTRRRRVRRSTDRDLDWPYPVGSFGYVPVGRGVVVTVVVVTIEDVDSIPVVPGCQERAVGEGPRSGAIAVPRYIPGRSDLCKCARRSAAVRGAPQFNLLQVRAAGVRNLVRDR